MFNDFTEGNFEFVHFCVYLVYFSIFMSYGSDQFFSSLINLLYFKTSPKKFNLVLSLKRQHDTVV